MQVIVNLIGMQKRSEVLGYSHQGRPIECIHLLGSGTTPFSPGILILGGKHGDERATVPLLERFIDELETQCEAQPLLANVYVIPCLNPDGYALNTRYNGRGVDINRNFLTGWSGQSQEPSGTHPESEIETQILRDWVLEKEPAAIVSLHWALAELDADGPQSLALVQAMWLALPVENRATYRWRISPAESENSKAGQGQIQAPPGSFGRWAGHTVRFAKGERPAMITLELPYRSSAFPRPDPLPDAHWAEVLKNWSEDRENYLNYTYQDIRAMLLVACQFGIESKRAP